MAEKAVDRIYRSCVQAQAGEERLRPILDPYNREGSTRFVDFRTTKSNLLQTDPRKCHVNFVVWDSNWEAGFAQAVQAMPEVLAYVKNQNLGFEVPYVEAGEERRYRPDFVLLIDDGRTDGPLHLVVEIKGFRDSDAQAKADTIRKLWVPAVNNHGAFGRWAFLEHREKYDVEKGIRAFIASLHADAPA